MNEIWKKRLPLFCAVLGGVLLAGAVLACAGLTLGSCGDCLFVGLSLLVLGALAEALVWAETRDLNWVLAMLLPPGVGLTMRTTHTTNCRPKTRSPDAAGTKPQKRALTTR